MVQIALLFDVDEVVPFVEVDIIDEIVVFEI
jgi:hypothetical protein